MDVSPPEPPWDPLPIFPGKASVGFPSSCQTPFSSLCFPETNIPMALGTPRLPLPVTPVCGVCPYSPAPPQHCSTSSDRLYSLVIYFCSVGQASSPDFSVYSPTFLPADLQVKSEPSSPCSSSSLSSESSHLSTEPSSQVRAISPLVLRGSTPRC